MGIPQEYRSVGNRPRRPDGSMFGRRPGAERGAAERPREAERSWTGALGEQVDRLQGQIVQLRAEAETAERGGRKSLTAE